jgi:P-type E1-E2 ATPase
MFVISLSIIREGFEDLSRHRSDLRMNSYKSVKYQDGSWHEANWKDICVGDIVRVERDDKFPADLVCLATSDPEGNCYIETGSLDGEKNSKPRNAFKSTQEHIGLSDTIRIMGEITVPGPNANLYDISGTLRIGSD